MVSRLTNYGNYYFPATYPQVAQFDALVEAQLQTFKGAHFEAVYSVLLQLDLPVPDYSGPPRGQICRRQKGLQVPFAKRLNEVPVHLVIDCSDRRPVA